MELYIVREEMMNKETSEMIDYSILLGVFDNKETAKNVATKALKTQMGFWEGSRTYKDLGGKGCGIVRVVLTNGEHTKRYIIEKKQLNQSRYNAEAFAI